jgi:AAA domain-containing protein
LLHLKDVAGRRAVVLLSDGRDENNPGTAPGSTHRLDEVLELQRQVQAVIYTVGLGPKLVGAWTRIPSEEAERQLAIAIDWGRYAEVIAYDHSAGMIYLEMQAAPN